MFISIKNGIEFIQCPMHVPDRLLSYPKPIQDLIIWLNIWAIIVLVMSLLLIAYFLPIFIFNFVPKLMTVIIIIHDDAD